MPIDPNHALRLQAVAAPHPLLCITGIVMRPYERASTLLT